MTLEWKPPKDNGGANITEYVIEKREALRMAWKSVGSTSETNFRVGRLSEGTQYVFRVAAENKVGVGEYEELSRSIAAKSPHNIPGPPSNVRVSDIFADSCVVSWSPPMTDGGSPVLGYTLERRAHTAQSWAKVHPRLITDLSYQNTELVEGMQYEYRVIAENKVGPSNPSPPSSQITAKDPWDKPGAPGTPKITDVTKRACTLHWSTPISDGGSEIKRYAVEYKVAGTFRWTRANDGERTLDTNYKVTGLHTDQEYEFRVAAENKAGLGPYSEVTLPVKAKDREGRLYAVFLKWLIDFFQKHN